MAFKLRFRHFYRNDRREAFHKVFPGNGESHFFEKAIVVAIFLEFAGKCPAETTHVGTSIAGTNVVYKGNHIFRIRRIVGNRHFHINPFFVGGDVNGFVDQLCFGLIQKLYKFLQATLGMETFAFKRTILFFFTLIGEFEAQSLVQERKFAQAMCEDIKFVFGRFKNFGIGQKCNNSTAVGGIPDHAYIVFWFALTVFLFKHLAFAVHFGM